MKKIGILYHPKVEATQQKACDVETLLRNHGVTVWVHSSWEPARIEQELEGTDLVITVGGDGTILRAVQIVSPCGIPVTGINLGKLGFMTEIGNGDEEESLVAILEGKGWIDERTMLQAGISDGNRMHVMHALNDVVVARGAVARLIRVDVTIDGQPCTTYKADGVIVATATGSTGYTLAAGGPVMYPHSPDLLMTAVAPHLSAAYPVVLPGSSEIVLRVTTYQPATLSVDGHINQPLGDGDEVRISRSERVARFLRVSPRESFFGTLEQKLKRKK